MTTTMEKSQEGKLAEQPFGGCTLRVRKARERSRSTVPSICLEKAQIITEVFKKTEGEGRAMRQAKAFKELCKRGTIFVQDDELIIGNPGGRVRATILNPDCTYWILSEELDTLSSRRDPIYIDEDQKKLFKESIEPYWKGKTFWEVWQATAPAELQELQEARITSLTDGMDTSSHGVILPDYELVIKIGFNGIRKMVKEKLASLDASVPGDYDKITYLRALLTCCEGVDILAKRYARLAEEKASEEKDPRRKAELEQVAENCRQVPLNPARTFWEALQAEWFYQVYLLMGYGNGDYCQGRMDQYLYPYYKKDIEEGRLTREQAQELIECLWVKFSELSFLVPELYTFYVPGGPTFQQVTCGGVTASGQDGVNDISYMMIQATMDIRATQPNLSVKYNRRKNPDSFIRKAAELAALGMGSPQFFNDETGAKYLMELGISSDDAYNWSPLGCKDAGLTGKMGIWHVPVIINLGAVLELTFLNGRVRHIKHRLQVPKTGDPRTFKTFEEFRDAFKKQLAYQIKKAAGMALIVEELIQQLRPDPMTSLTHKECIDNAKDFFAGGPKYNPPGEIATVGLADTFNSLFSIKKLIYDDKKLTWDQLLEALGKDFEGHETIREMCLAVPKYGNDIPEVDEIANEITHFTSQEARQYQGLYGGGNRIIETTAAGHHVPNGEIVGALPSGRKAWMPLSDGISPMQGTDKEGPTAVLKSISKCSLGQYYCPMVNMKLDPALFKDERGMADFVSLLKTWHDLGLYHVQFNIVDVATLRDAQKHPENHRGLMVRVSGYCAYFVDLYKGIQDDIITRTTFPGTC